MGKKLFLVLQFAVLLATISFSLVMDSKLPNVVPTHWNMAGQVDQYGSKALDLWLMPGIELAMVGLTFLLPILSPKRYEVDRFASTFAYVMFLVTALMGALHLVIVRKANGGAFDMGGAMFAVMFLFFMGIGNVMGKVKQNFFVGIRTPWTLAEPAVWDRTHREAGHLWLVGGLIGAALALCGLGMPILIAYLMLLALIPVVRSYIWYRRLVQPGGSDKGNHSERE